MEITSRPTPKFEPHHVGAYKPLVSHQVIVQLIGSTTTETGLKVCCEIDCNLYPKGVKITEHEMRAINIARHDFHHEWNYSISPNQQPPDAVISRQGLS